MQRTVLMETLIIKQDVSAAYNAQLNNFIDFLHVVIQKHYIIDGQV